MFSSARLRTRLILIALTAVLPALAVIVYNQARDRAEVRARALENSLRVARAAASQQASVFSGAHRLLTTLAHVPGLRAATDTSACEAFLPDVLRDHPGYVNIVAINADGSVFCSAKPLAPNRPRPSNGWLGRVLQARRTVVGDYQISATDGQPDVVVAVPLLDDAGRAFRVIGAGLTLRDLGHLAAQLKLPDGGVVTLFDRNYTVLARYPDTRPSMVGRRLPEALAAQRVATAGREAISDSVNVDGIRRFEVTVPVESDLDTRMFVTLGVDRSAAFSGVNANLRRLLLMLLLVTCAAVLVGTIGGELFVLRPAKVLHGVTSRLAAGDFTARAALDRGVPGLAEVAGAVNAMASALETRQHERDTAERELRASEDRYRHLFENNPHAMWVHEAESLRIVAANQSAAEQYGYTRDELLQLTVADLHVNDEWRGAGGRDYKGISQHRRKDGRAIDVEVRGNPVHWKGRRALLVLADDISSRTRLEEHLRRTQRIEAIGLLAGGIAHDFNNLLTAIHGYGELLRDSLGPDQVQHAQVEEIMRASRRAADLTRQLLAFGRKQIMAPRVVRLGDAVRELTPMLRRIIGETIDLKAIIDDGDNVRADPGQIEQVVMNLVVNARDAMPNGGRLTIETADIRLTDEHVRRHPFMRPGPHVMLAVSDTGHGMDAATQSRVFDPFFTTKPQGQGTGLGLSTVYGVVKQSGGYICVSSDVGRGTRFEVYLPRTDEPIVTEAPPIEQAPACRGTETILLVEDEDTVRHFTTQVLQRYGYTVHPMLGPLEALWFVREHTGAIDLLLSDVVLPDMSGRDLANQVRQIHPGTRILYMSGYATDAIVDNGVLDPDTPFLQKPFTAAGLARKVREILDAPVPTPAI